MKKIITLKDFPFLLTLLFGLIGYQVNNITDNILNSPSIEFDLSVRNSEKRGDEIYKSYECVITNITNNKLFKDLTINFKRTKNSSLKIYNPKMTPLPPSSQHYIDPESLDKKILIYTVLKLQPGDKYRLNFETKSKIDSANDHPEIFLTSNDPVRITEKSISTWFVKNFNLINLILIIFWTILIIIYFSTLNSNSNEENISK
jgi:hypothetical protein